VHRGLSSRLAVLGVLLVYAAFAIAQTAAKVDDSQKLERAFQSAVGQYHAGKFDEAESQLENLLALVPDSFEVHELLGLIYAAQKKNDKALEQLQIAVRLKPDSADAATNLATALSRAGKIDLAGDAFRRALSLAPQDFSTNHDLAEYYLQSDKIPDALPLLEKAQQIEPAAYDNGYDLALAYFLTGRLSDAQQSVDRLLVQKNTGELHNLLGQIDEKQGKYVEAANEFGTAAHMDPSEDNLFAWGSELLLHKTYVPAIEVFRRATQLHPDSARLAVGLGMALYSRGVYEEAVRSLLVATDLAPSDPRCYLFLSKAYLISPSQAEDVIQRFRRYAELEPRNALAQYYYAVSLLKGRRLEVSSTDFRTIESLLRKSIALDGKLAVAHLQLGILYADQHEDAKSLPEYERALALNPQLPDAHYRLGQYFVRVGQKDRAKQEFAVYQQLQSQHQAEIDKERAEVQFFVYSVKDNSSVKQ